MNWLDVLAALLLVLAVPVGYRVGATRQVGGLLGGGLALALAVLLIMLASRQLALIDALSRVILLVGALLVAFLIGHRVGVRVGGSLVTPGSSEPMMVANRITGAVVCVLQVALLLWLVGGLVGSGHSKPWTQMVDGSVTLRGLSRLSPTPMDMVQGLESSVLNRGTRSLFPGWGEIGGNPASLPSGARARRIARAADPSTVKVITSGCNWQSSGSGAVVAPDYVVTNAHVVDGGHGVTITKDRDAQTGTVVAFDPKVDLALVHVPGFPAPALPLSADDAERGDVGVALGYPGGGELVAAKASVNREILTLGKNAIDGTSVTRDVVELHSLVAPGDSGGPFVLSDNTIGGIVFAKSPKQQAVGYALPASVVSRFVSPSLGKSAAVSVHPC